MVLFYAPAISLLVAVACAQPQSVPARSTRAITLLGDDIYLYGGSGTGGDCYSDFYSLHLDPSNGWVAGQAPWNNIKEGTTSGPALGADSWAVGSTDGTSLLFYGQTLCPQQLAKNADSPHTFTSSSASVQFHHDSGAWAQSATTLDILGPRLAKDDAPTPVQVVDASNHIVYTFVYDIFNPLYGMQLWSFSTDHPPANIAQSAKNTTMVTTRPPLPPPPANGTNATLPMPPPEVSTVLAPFVDVGSAVYHDGTIVIVGGGKPTGTTLTGDDIDAASGWYKMDRCWVYTIATNEWSVRNLTAAGGNFPLPRRLAALISVNNKIYMHGGNTTQTVATDNYAKDLWILDTNSWQWTAGPDSTNGRASHTLINYQNTLLSLSGFEFETSKVKAAPNAFVMMYDLGTSTWGAQFGLISQSFFQKHAVAIIGGSVAGFILILIVASVGTRLWRKHARGPSRAAGVTAGGMGISRKRSNKPFLASTAAHKTDALPPHSAAANRLSGMTLAQGVSRGPYETQIDLSALPRASESTMYDQHHYPQQNTFNPYAPVNQQQEVPLMSANALEQQGQELEPYADDDQPEEKDARPLAHAVLPHSDGHAGNTSQLGSYTHPSQTAGISGVPSRDQMGIRSNASELLGSNAVPRR
ncbi:hypothetical protein EDD11_004371 [Mortierella claussenii]|nr:hypothetical protein EDD11_004371 [Mortierella claussenii]